MTAGGYGVTPEELRTHGQHLDGLVDRLHTATSAAQVASMPDDSYGLLCAFLPAIISPMEQKAMEAISAATEGVSGTAENIRTTAKAYDDQEDAVREPLRQFKTEAEDMPAASRQLTSTTGTLRRAESNGTPS